MLCSCPSLSPSLHFTPTKLSHNQQPQLSHNQAAVSLSLSLLCAMVDACDTVCLLILLEVCLPSTDSFEDQVCNLILTGSVFVFDGLNG